MSQHVTTELPNARNILRSFGRSFTTLFLTDAPLWSCHLAKNEVTTPGSRQFSLAQNKSRRFQTRALAAAEVVTLDFNEAELGWEIAQCFLNNYDALFSGTNLKVQLQGWRK